MTNQNSSIRLATEDDVKSIETWLAQEKKQGIEGNFLRNWNVIMDFHSENNLIVQIDGSSQAPVAFQCGGLIEPGILQVRNDMRHKGIGRNLVEYCFTQTYKRDECILHIKCEPESSIPFWNRMGFTLISSPNDENDAYRLLRKSCHSLLLAARLKPYSASIRRRKWNDSVSPYEEFAPHAIMSADGEVHLSERILIPSDVVPGDSDEPVLEIEIDGRAWYLDKVKYAKAESHGIRHCRNGYYIDRVLPVL